MQSMTFTRQWISQELSHVLRKCMLWKMYLHNCTQLPISVHKTLFSYSNGRYMLFWPYIIISRFTPSTVLQVRGGGKSFHSHLATINCEFQWALECESQQYHLNQSVMLRKKDNLNPQKKLPDQLGFEPKWIINSQMLIPLSHWAHSRGAAHSLHIATLFILSMVWRPQPNSNWFSLWAEFFSLSASLQWIR